MKKTSLQRSIERHLKKVLHASAPEIAKAIGAKEYQGSVNNTLNFMCTHGIAQCEHSKERRNGRAREMVYWVSNSPARMNAELNGELVA